MGGGGGVAGDGVAGGGAMRCGSSAGGNEMRFVGGKSFCRRYLGLGRF